MPNIDGSEFNDSLNGGAGDDVIRGFGGNDIIRDEAGGNDQLYGGDGADFIYLTRRRGTPAGTGLIDGGAGNDNIEHFEEDGFVGNVTVNAGDGDDYFGTSGGDRVTVNMGLGTTNW